MNKTEIVYTALKATKTKVLLYNFSFVMQKIKLVLNFFQFSFIK